MTKIISSKSAKVAAGVMGLIAGFAMITTTVSAYTFSTNLKVGSTGVDVLNLQKVLNMNADTKVDGTGAGSAGKETSYFGPATKSAVIRFQEKFASDILAPVGLTAGTGFVGASTRAHLNGVTPSTTGMVTGCSSLVGFSATTGQSCATGATTSTVSGCTSVVGFSSTTGQKCDASTVSTTSGTATGAGFNVTLASDSPMSGALVAGQALGDLAHYTFSNNSGSDVKVTNITLNRTGVSNDATLANVYLYDGVNRLTDSTSVSSGKVTFNSSTGIFTIPAGTSKTVKVLGDIAASTAGQVVGVSLASVTSTGTLTTTLPVNGGFMNIATADIGTLAFQIAASGSASSVDPQNDYIVWQNTVTVGVHALNLKALTLRNVGSINTSDIKNFRLYVDGTLLSTVANLDSNGYVTFDLSAAPKSLATGARIMKVVADIVGGSTRTFMMSLRQASDVTAVDSDINQPVLATGNDSSTTGTFSARSATSATITSGSVSVSKAGTSPSSDIAVGSTNVLFGRFEFRAAGENIKIENLNVQANTLTANTGLDNGKVFFNGVQVGSTKDLTEATDVNFTFGSSLIVNAGTTGIIEIYADAKTTAGTNLASGDSASTTIRVGSSNAQGMSSLSTLSVPASATAANTLTVASATLTATKYSGYGNQTMVAGRQNPKIGSFVLSAGSADSANVDTITVALSAAEAASLTDLMLKDALTGVQIGTTKTTVGTSNGFSVNISLPVNGTKTIDIYSTDIKSGANVGPITASVTASGTSGLGSSVSATTSGDLQTITVGTGSLTLAVAAGNPISANVIAGTSNVKVGQFKFTAANDSYTIEKLKIKVSNNAATSTTGVTLSYKNAAGATQTVFQTMTTGTEADATATFEGLTLYVPSTGDAALLDVSVSIPTIASGASSGAAITATIDWDNGFQSKNSAGTAATTIGSADVASSATTGYGTFYVRKTVPVFTKVASGVTTPATGQALYKFDITADTASSIELKKISLAIATTTINVAALSLYEVGISTAINTAAVEVNSDGNAIFYAGTSANDTVITVGAGGTKHFEVKGTVTNWGAAGDAMTISFAEDTAAEATATSVSHPGEIVWSDLSATSHTTATADWINSFLVKDLSNDVQSYSF